MSRWRRLGLSLLSLVIIDAAASVFFATINKSPDPWWKAVVAWLGVISLFAVSGWVVALPFILCMRPRTRTGLWIMGIIGVMIGPFVIGVLDLISWKLEPSGGADFGWGFVVIATGISSLTTAVYLTPFARDIWHPQFTNSKLGAQTSKL